MEVRVYEICHKCDGAGYLELPICRGKVVKCEDCGGTGGWEIAIPPAVIEQVGRTL
jgi:DnaJ-class molecular chaperone